MHGEQGMTILQINTTFGYGSTGSIVESLYELSRLNGIQAYAAYQRANKPVLNGYQLGNILDWKLHALLTRITGKQGFYSTIATKRFLRWCDAIHPNIIHVHNLHSNFINLPLLCDYCAEKKVALILTLHDCWFFTGKCSHFVHTNCDHWEKGCGNCSQLKREVLSLFFDNTGCVLRKKQESYRRVEEIYVIGCSEWISSLARKSILKEKNIRTIRNGIDTKLFNGKDRCTAKRLLNLEGKFVILGFADKWCDIRNHDGVAAVLNSLHHDDVVVIVGCNNAQKKYFRSVKQVVAMQFISDKKWLANIYRAADVFINLTHADTLPTVNMESICCGTPVITFDCGGSSELIDEDDGFVVPENDFEGIVTAIQKIHNGYCLFDAAEKAKKFDKVRCFEKYIQLYYEIMEKA